MLESLTIRNFIMVEEMHIELGKGLLVLTGETGAGKSIIAGAISLLLGSSVKSQIHYDNTKKVYLEGLFSCNPIKEGFSSLCRQQDIELEEDQIFFVREISPDGRSSSFINGRRVTNAIVREFRDYLLDFHSQRDQILLFDHMYQLELLDRYAELTTERAKVETLYQQLQEEKKKLHSLQEQEKNQAEKQRLYSYQLQEIQELGFTVDEDEQLQNEFNLLNHAKDILQLSSAMNYDLYEKERSVYDIINEFMSKLVQYSEDSGNIASSINHLQESLVHLDDAVSEMRVLENTVNLDTSRLNEIEERLNQLNQIKTKYNLSLQQILDYAKQMKTEMATFLSLREDIEYCMKDIEEMQTQLTKQALQLSACRKVKGSEFSTEIQNNLQLLALPEAKFVIEVNSNENQIREYGIDELEFCFSGNKGNSVQPIKNTMSGGELSRLLLVVKKILAGKDSPRSIIFDEIDSGIGGKTADRLGNYIALIAEIHQIMCITHLPQVASYAQKHYLIEKLSIGERSEISIRELDAESRIAEIARMLSGNVTPTALEHARELLTKNRIIV